MVSAFWWSFQQKVAKSDSFREKARKIIYLTKVSNFSSKLPCFGVWLNYSGKSCKKWLISWKSTKNHRFGQKLQLFEQTTMFRRFGQLFSKKWLIWWKSTKTHQFGQNLTLFGECTKFGRFGKLFSEKWLMSWKSTKNHRFDQNLQIFEQTIMFRHFGQLFSKKSEKVAHVVKKHENSSIWPKLATFRGNYHVLAFWLTFQQKVAKSGSFRQKERKVMDLLENLQVFQQTSLFRRFGQVFSKKWLISWKGTKNHRFGQN